MAVIFVKIFDAIPVRFNLWVMIFTSCWVSYMLRVNMSLNLIAMVAPVEQNVKTRAQNARTDDDGASVLGNDTLRHADISDVSHTTAEMLTNDDTRLDWSSNQQALVLGSYFWSYPVTSLVGGMAAERWGSRLIILISSLSSAVLTALSPAAANWHYMALVVVRFLIGLAGGLVYPALHALVAQWVPAVEKGKFVSAMMGGTLGTVVTWSLTGPLMEKYGWASAFYVPAAITLAWSGLWWYLVADTPKLHPRISDKERDRIIESLGDKVKKTKSLPPFRSIFTSIHFLAMVVLHYGNLWGLFFIMTVGPKFVSSVLGFQLSAAGVISALPYLARMFAAGIFGTLGDYILVKKVMSPTAIRKSFCLFSHIIPGVFLVLLVYIGNSAALSVTLITLSMGFNGAATITNLQNHQDLAPNYAGTLYGIANFVGSTAGFIAPILTAYFTQGGHSIEQWRPVFFLGASVYIISALFFILFGSALTQPWNDPPQPKEEEDRSKVSQERETKDMPLSIIS